MSRSLSSLCPGFAAAFVLAAALSAVSTADPASLPPVDALVARVNGDAVTVSDVMREVPRLLAEVRREPDAPADNEALFQRAFVRALREIEDRRLVVQKYWAGEARIPAHAIDRTTAEILEDRYGGNLQNLLDDLSARRLTYTEWRDEMEERLIVASMRRSFAEGAAFVPPSAVRAAWEADRAAAGDASPRLRVWIATWPERAGADAFVAAHAEEGAPVLPDLAALAARPDEAGGTARNYGSVDPSEDLAPALAAAATALPDGGLSKPVELGGSFYVVFREGSLDGARTLAEAWPDLSARLLAEERAAAFRKWVSRLRADATIEEFLPFPE